MAWMMDEYSKANGRTQNAVVTGKPLVLGGSLGRKEATGRGVMVTCLQAMETLKMNPSETSVAVQGFGNVGSNAAILLQLNGLKIKAISDHTGAYWNDNGLDIEQAIRYREANNFTLDGFTGGERISNADLLTSQVDVLVPAAMEDVITPDNAGDIQARLIVEGANGPTTSTADKIIYDKGISVIPDILANAGGVTVSYFEWVQNRLGFKWDIGMVNKRHDRIMSEAFDRVYQTSIEYDVSMRIASYILSIKKVADTYKMRGGY
jgi:glutamate dehydrogenase (NAD(P)+)